MWLEGVYWILRLLICVPLTVMWSGLSAFEYCDMGFEPEIDHLHLETVDTVSNSVWSSIDIA